MLIFLKCTFTFATFTSILEELQALVLNTSYTTLDALSPSSWHFKDKKKSNKIRLVVKKCVIQEKSAWRVLIAPKAQRANLTFVQNRGAFMSLEMCASAILGR